MEKIKGFLESMVPVLSKSLKQVEDCASLSHGGHCLQWCLNLLAV